MAQSLTDFLIGNPIVNITKDVVVSERLKDFKFKIRNLTGTEADEVEKKNKGNDGVYRNEANYILAACIYPNFSDAELIKNAGCRTPIELIDKTLLPGEQDALYRAISEISGFTGFKAQVEEAKN